MASSADIVEASKCIDLAIVMHKASSIVVAHPHTHEE